MKKDETQITETIEVAITPMEDDLIEAFRKLSDEAKEKIIALIRIMVENGR